MLFWSCSRGVGLIESLPEFSLEFFPELTSMRESFTNLLDSRFDIELDIDLGVS